MTTGVVSRDGLILLLEDTVGPKIADLMPFECTTCTLEEIACVKNKVTSCLMMTELPVASTILVSTLVSLRATRSIGVSNGNNVVVATGGTVGSSVLGLSST